MIIAGEASGDLHGAKLVEAMLAKDPALFICGVGGPKLEAVGVRILVQASELAVVGITEVFSKLGSLLKGVSRVKKILRGLKPDLLIIIDFPDFNLHAAGIAKRQGIPVLYYISPQVWAWRKGRVKKIKRLVDHVGVILPFEEKFYKEHDVPVTFVGHPLLDDMEYQSAESTKTIPQKSPLVGLLPGSRDKEVLRNLPVMLEAALKVKHEFPDIRFCISKASSVKLELIDQLIKSSPLFEDIQIVSGHVSTIFNQCLLVVAVSGTVTLEAAISGTPTIIIYSVSPLSYWIGRALINVQHIGLINLIGGKTIVPELIQKEAAPDNIANYIKDLITHPEKLKKMQDELILAREFLGEPGASRRAASLAFDLLENPNE